MWGNMKKVLQSSRKSTIFYFNDRLRGWYTPFFDIHYDKQVVNGRTLVNIYQRYFVKVLHIMSRCSFLVAGTSAQLPVSRLPGTRTAANRIASPWRIHRDSSTDNMPRHCDPYDSIVQHEPPRYVTEIRANQWNTTRYTPSAHLLIVFNRASDIVLRSYLKQGLDHRWCLSVDRSDKWLLLALAHFENRILPPTFALSCTSYLPKSCPSPLRYSWLCLCSPHYHSQTEGLLPAYLILCIYPT